jgi:hypothetical protein
MIFKSVMPAFSTAMLKDEKPSAAISISPLCCAVICRGEPWKWIASTV